MIFAYEHIARTRPYPNLGCLAALPGTSEWYQFSRTWPYVEPWQVWEYMLAEKIPNIHARRVQDLGNQSAWYPVALSFFDHGIDYIDLIPAATQALIRSGQLCLLVYYSEGDNPLRIQARLHDLCDRHDISRHNLHIITANSACDSVPGMTYFADDEMLYRLRNKHTPCDWNDQHRSKSFTALVRTHKTWRAWTMARFWQEGMHVNSWFAYDTDTVHPAADQGNPLQTHLIPGIQEISDRFLKAGPFQADTLGSDIRNDYHRGHVPAHFQDSYLNIILETHMDVDQSGGVFLTEKTFKPIKHCQPFVIFGAHGSLQILRELGYKTFDHVIDPTYDTLKDTTERWLCLQATLHDLWKAGLHNIDEACRSDCQHNQRVFLAPKQDRLNRLLGRLQHDNQ